MKKLKLIGLFVGGFVLGAIAAGLWSGYVFSRLTVPKSVDLAVRAAEEANWLALLRLNEPQSVIKDMENSMDGGVATIAQWAEIRPPDDRTRSARDRFLTSVKVYHESYPASGATAARVDLLLANVPGRNPESACKNGICRLDDFRRGVTSTNSTTK